MGRGLSRALCFPADAERDGWRTLWADVADTLARAQGQGGPPKKPPTK
jgi:hypothetical protein